MVAEAIKKNKIRMIYQVLLGFGQQLISPFEATYMGNICHAISHNKTQLTILGKKNNDILIKLHNITRKKINIEILNEFCI